MQSAADGSMKTKHKVALALFCCGVMLVGAQASMAQQYVVVPSPIAAPNSAAPAATLVLHIPTVLESGKEPYTGYYQDTASIACAQQVMPGGRLFTADTSRAIQDCMQKKHHVYRPVQTVSAVQSPLNGLSPATIRQTYIEQMKRDTAQSHVKGSPLLKELKPATAPVTIAKTAPAAPSSATPVSVAAAAPMPAAPRAPAQNVTLTAKPAEAADSSTSLFLQSGDSGPSPIFLH
jgi:hypothetical protein